MDPKSVENMPSQTALFNALRRALAHKRNQDERLGSDDLAEIFLPGYYRFFLKFAWVRQNTQQKLEAFMPGLNDYLIARTAFFDQIFREALQEQVPQIVLLGAGYDSRAYRFAKLNRSTRIFELDAPPTQERKVKCLKDAKVSIPSDVQFVPVNFMHEALGDVLEKAGYQSLVRTLFVWEGVSYYLDREAVRETLGFVSRSSGPGSLIAFDYTIPISEDNEPALYGTSQFRQSMQEEHANEAFLFSISDAELETFLEEMNLRLVKHLDAEKIEQSYLTGVDGKRTGRITGNFRFACATPGR